MSESLKTFADLEAFLSRFTNYERLQFMPYDRETFGVERMRSFASELGDPQERYPSIHVAGTKGKGSTCLIVEALLSACNRSVGTYLSPHVEHLRERIRVRGRSLEEGEMVEDANALIPALSHRSRTSGEFPTFFEIVTAIAMVSFARRGVDWGIFEVGLGGRLDATNILQPRISAITSIGLEHTQQLGNTIEEIAREKGGIIKHGVPVVLGPLLPEAERTLREMARERSAPVIPVGEDAVRREADGRVRIVELDAVLDGGPILGPALRQDLGLAITLARRVLDAEDRPLSADHVARALTSLSLPARVEIFPGTPPIVVDAAHTAEAVKALRIALEETGFPHPRTLVFSLAVAKQVVPILAELRGLAGEIIWTRADVIRSMPPQELRALHGSGTVIEDPTQALEEAIRRGNPVVTTGSFYLAGRLRPLVRQRAAAP